MVIKLFQSFFTLFIALSFLNNSSFAQGEIPEDVIVGGKARCVLNGRVPIRRFVADGNRLLILQAGDINKGSIIIQSIFEKKDIAVDINVLGLLGEIPNLDVFLSGEILNFEDDASDLKIKTMNKNDGITSEVTNQDKDGEKSALNGRIKLTKFENDLASGILRFVFQKIFFDAQVNEDDPETNENAGKVILICRFKKVPVAIKELSF